MPEFNTDLWDDVDASEDEENKLGLQDQPLDDVGVPNPQAEIVDPDTVLGPADSSGVRVAEDVGAPPEQADPERTEQVQKALALDQVPSPVDPNDTFYDIETDTIVPGASFAHRVNEQYWHGMSDLSLDDPFAINFNGNTDTQMEAFLTNVLINFPKRTGRALRGVPDIIGQVLGGLSVAGEELVRKSTDADVSLVSGGAEPRSVGERLGEGFKAAYEAATAPFRLTDGGLDNEAYLEQFEVLAEKGDSSKLIDLAESAAGRELTGVEKNQITARFDEDEDYRSLAFQSLSNAERKAMLTHQPQRWGRPDLPWLFDISETELETEGFYRKEISRSVVNGEYWKAGWLTGQQVGTNLLPMIASFWAGGQVGALMNGAKAAKAATVVQRGAFKFSPSMLKSAPKTGLIMSMITPGTIEERFKTFAAMTGYAATAGVTTVLGNFGRRAVADFALNSGISAVINPHGEHFFEMGGMYREMYRQARFEADRVGMDELNSNALAALYMTSVALPDALFGAWTGHTGAKIQPQVKQAGVEAQHHWIRKELELGLKGTDMKREERDMTLQSWLTTIYRVSEMQQKPMDEVYNEIFQREDGMSPVRVVKSGDQIVMAAKRAKASFQPKTANTGDHADTGGGDPRAKALQDIVMNQRGFGSQVEFNPVALRKGEAQMHADAVERSLSNPDEVFRQYQQHPEFGRMMEENGIGSYKELVDWSYEGLRTDIDEAYSMIGVEVQQWKGDVPPYRNMQEQLSDIRNNRNLWVVRTDSEHEHLGTARGLDDQGLTYGDKLKAIRLFFGHAGGSHDATPHGVRNAQARVSQLLSDGGNVAFAAEGGLASTRWGHESLGVALPSRRHTDGTADPSEAFFEVGAAPRDFSGERALPEGQHVTFFDDITQFDTPRVIEWVKQHPDADPREFAATADHWDGVAEQMNAVANRSIAATGGLNETSTGLLGAASAANQRANMYREASQNLVAQSLGAPPAGVRQGGAVILPPEFADWRAGLTQRSADPSIQESRVPPELLRPIRRARTDKQVADAKKTKITQDSHLKNAEKNESRMNQILAKYKDKDISNTTVWQNMWFDMTGETSAPVAPAGLRQILADGPQGLTRMIQDMDAGQLRDFGKVMQVTDEIRATYDAGKAKPSATAMLSLWGALSPRLSPYPQESGFMEVVLGNGRMREFIQNAEDGRFSLKEFSEWVDTFYPPDSGKPGAQAKSNLNAYGERYLVRMYKPVSEGKYKGERPITVLHRLLSDPNVSGRQLRREWYKFMEPKAATGIDIKVLSFMAEMAGKRDVMVLDRVQADHLWDGERTYGVKNIYDGIQVGRSQRKNSKGELMFEADGVTPKWKIQGSGISAEFTGHKGIAMYELFEDLLAPIAREGFSRAGVPWNDMGAWHIATWMKRSGQTISHEVLQGQQRMMDGVDDPLMGASVKQGKFNRFFFGFRNTYFGTKGPDDFRHTYTDSEGTNWIMSHDEMRQLRKVADVYQRDRQSLDKGKPLFVRVRGKKIRVSEEDRFIPKKFTFNRERRNDAQEPTPTDRPWTERDEVKLEKLERWIRRIGLRPDVTEANIIAAGSRSTGIAPPKRAGLEELTVPDNIQASRDDGGNLQAAALTLNNGKKLLYLLESSGTAAAHHEMFHAIWEFVPEGTQNLMVPALQREGIDVGVEGWSERAKEFVTRQYERYLRDGQAPTPELENLFSLISKYMRKEYRTIKGSPISTRVSAESRRFFDQLYVPDGKYIAPNIGYVQREEQDLYGFIEAYDRDPRRPITRTDPQEVGALAKDAARLRLEIGPENLHVDVVARAASHLNVNKVSYRAGRRVYRKLLRSILQSSLSLNDKFMDDLSRAWATSGNSRGNKTIEALSDRFRQQGVEPADLNAAVGRLIDQYAKTKTVPDSFEDLKQKVGQTTGAWKKWIKEVVDPINTVRRQEGYAEHPVLKALSDGDLMTARNEARKGQLDESVTNANGTYDRHAQARWEGRTGDESNEVLERGHSTRISKDFQEEDGFTYSTTSLSENRYEGKPIRLYAYHPDTKQLVPATDTQTFEGLTQTIPNSRLREWVRIDVDSEGEIVGTSGETAAQVEAFALMRATDPNIRWVPDAEQTPGLYGLDDKILNTGQFVPDGAMAEYTVQPKARSKMFTGQETATDANRIYTSPEFKNWQRRVQNIVEPQALRDVFLSIDSSSMDARARKRLKDNFMAFSEQAAQNVDHIAPDTLKAALPKKRQATTRNMLMALENGGDATAIIRMFNDLQDRAGLRNKINDVDLEDVQGIKGEYQLTDREAQAAADASQLGGMPEQFFRDVIKSGELVFPDPVSQRQGYENMVRTLLHVGKKRTKAVAFQEKIEGASLTDRNKIMRNDIWRLATSARYAFSRLAAETGNLKVHFSFRNVSGESRRAGNAVKTRFTTLFDPDSIKGALQRNGETAPTKVKNQLYPLIRDTGAQTTIARWLGTEPGTKGFDDAQAAFQQLPPGFRGVGYSMREELQGASAANLRRLQYHDWRKVWTRVGDEWRDLKSREFRLDDTEFQKFKDLTSEVLRNSPFQRKADGKGVERVPIETMLEAHNKFVTGNEASFHEYLKTQGWGSRQHYWLTVRPEQFDALFEPFSAGLDPLPRAPAEADVHSRGMPGSISPRQQKTALAEENILNNLYQHMSRYEVLSRTVTEAEFLRDEINKMQHLRPEEKAMLGRDLMNVQGYGQELRSGMKKIAGANRLFWNSYILTTNRFLWYTVRNKFQPYALMASQFPMKEMMTAMPELLRSARNPGSNLRKAFAEVFQSDIEEGSSFARQSLTDENSDISSIRASRLGQHFDNFMNGALPFSDKRNRLEVYSMGYTLAERAIRDVQSGKHDIAKMQRRLALLNLDPSEQLDLMSRFNRGDMEGFKREYAKIKNLNVNFAYRTGERALLLQDSNTRTLASLITWPLGAAEIVVRNSMKPMIDGLATGNTEQMMQGLKAFGGYVFGMYVTGELYSLIFGDKGGAKTYHPLFSAASFSVQSPGLGFIANMFGGADELSKANTDKDIGKAQKTAEKMVDQVLYMVPMMPAIATAYEAVSNKRNVRPVDMTKSVALGTVGGMYEWLTDGGLRGQAPEGPVSLVMENIMSILDEQGYSEYRTGWEGWLHGIIGTFEEGKPDRWEESIVGASIMGAIEEMVEHGKKFMDEQEWDKVVAKFKRTHNLDLESVNGKSPPSP